MYDNLSDEQLSNALYEKYYSSMDRSDFNQQIGYEEPGFFDNVGDLGDLVRGAGYGVTSLPALAVEGVGALGYSLGLSDDLSENELVQWGRESQKGLREFFGGDEGTKAYGVGNALGSFDSFFIPGLGQAGLAA